MKHKIEFHAGGGIFSYVGILFENLLKWDKSGILDSSSIYVDNRQQPSFFPNKEVITLSKIGFNFFDLLFDQNDSNINNGLMTSEIHPVYINEFEKKRDEYRKISKKYLKLNIDIDDFVNNFVSNNFVNGKTLGVHIRMTDMNIHHPYLGQVKNEHYFKNIDNILLENDIEKIFVSSDNHESIELLKNRYGGIIIYNETNYRANKSNEDIYYKAVNNWIYNPLFYIDSFIDATLLSNCDITTGRNSLFNWGSQSFHWSKINKYYHINGDKSVIKDPNL